MRLKKLKADANSNPFVVTCSVHYVTMAKHTNIFISSFLSDRGKNVMKANIISPGKSWISKMDSENKFQLHKHGYLAVALVTTRENTIICLMYYVLVLFVCLFVCYGGTCISAR